MTDKETQGKLDLLAALLAGGVENWEGYDLALEEYRKNLAREEKAKNIADAMVKELGKYMYTTEKPRGYYLTDKGRDEAVRIILSRANELKELCDDKS